MTNTTLKVSKIRNAEYYNLVEIFDKLYADSMKGKTFRDLLSLITSENNIKLAYRNMRKNDGGKTPGVDGMTIKDLNSLSEQEFVDITRKKFRNYKPKRVKRVEIPKPNGKMRPLGIPTIWDRVIQQCLLQVLEPICEAKFFERSNGFRPNRSVENAMAQCYKLAQMYKLHYVVDVDIKGFFDNVNHGKLLKQLWNIGIQDKRVIAIISKMLKADIMLPDKTIQKSIKGTPQGGILSPLLANVVLNELDWWVASQWEMFPAKDFVEKARPDGKGTNRSSKYRRLERSNLKKCFIVRYADDFKVFCEDYNSAKRMKIAIEDFLFQRLHLETSKEKSRITNLEKEYSEFLGFKFKVIPKGTKWIVESHMCDKAIQRTKIKLKEALQVIKRTEGSANTGRAISDYNAAVYGIHQYFRIATMISQDVSDISYEIQHICKSRKLKRRITRTGNHLPKFIKDEYGNSKQLRFINDMAIIPIGYCKHKNPMYKQKSVNKYTPEGRIAIHKRLGVNTGTLQFMLENPVPNRSIEYNDNRLSLYSGQNGKCYVTHEQLEPELIHCHHIIPRHLGGGDEYQNLVLVTSDVHKLIHAEDDKLLKCLISNINIDTKARNKIDSLRSKANMNQINWESYIL